MNTSKFQLVITGFFAGLVILGILTFAFFKGRSTPQVSITMWGTVPADSFSEVLNQSPIFNDKTLKVSYVYKNEADFNRDLVEALASGIGPDVIFTSHQTILRHISRVFPIPYASLSERIFKDSYAEIGEIFLRSDGILAIPVFIDPLIMYWNRDIFTTAGISLPPKQWSEFYNLSSQLTQKDGALNISRSAAPLGESRNIRNSKELISTLFFQAGNPITMSSGSGFVSVLPESFNSALPPAETALTFFTEFSNPTKVFHSWNRSLPDSQDYFLAGNLATYFGFASEYSLIRLKNPNLNFDVANMPQSQSASRNITFGKVYGFALLKNSRNIAGGFNASFILASPETAQKFADIFSSAPARRDLLSKKPTDSRGGIVYDSAIWSRAWYDTNYEETSAIFQEMIESITGGRDRIQSSVINAHNSLNNLLKR